MKVKVVLTKGFKRNKITRTLKLGNRSHSKTAQSSFKDLNIPTTNNNITTIKKVNNTSKNKSQMQSNSKNKSNHIIINAKEKQLAKKNNETEINKKKNQNTITVSPYKKINLVKEKRNIVKSRENSCSYMTLKKNKYHNINDNTFDKEKLYFKTPIRMKKIGGMMSTATGVKTGLTGLKKINYNSKLYKHYLDTINCYGDTEKNNNSVTIMNLQKELESLKRVNLYKTMLISNMKQQIEEYQKQQQIIHENNALKEEIQLLKNKCNNMNNNINNEINYNIKYSNNNKIFKDIDLFDKLKYDYFNNQNQLNELKKENNELKNELNNKLNKNKIVKKNIEIILKGKPKKNNNNYNNNNNKTNAYGYYNNSNIMNLNTYIEKRYRLLLQKENEDVNNYYKPLNKTQINEIRYLIKMILNSNQISRDAILHLLFNNLTNFNEIINSIILDLLKTNSTFDKVLLRHYFTSLCIVEKNKTKIFNINNLFSEINYYYNEIEKTKDNYNGKKIHSILFNNENIKQLVNECKFKDQLNVGIIELNQFNDIFVSAYGNYTNNKKNKALYDLLIYIMKNYHNLNDLGLYNLCYLNLTSNIFHQKINNLKGVKDNENDNLGASENNDIQDIFSRTSFNKNNISNNLSNSNNIENNTMNSNKSNKILGKNTKNLKNNSSEDIVANVSINVEQSTALVNVKFKNHYDSDYDNNSVYQTSINGINSGKNEETLSENNNNNEEENILITSEDYQKCMDFVSSIFDFCLEKLHRNSVKNNIGILDDIIY